MEMATGSLSDKYVLGEVIGQGAFGVVKLAERKADGVVVVVKQINLSCMSPKEIADAQREVSILSQFDHANIIKYLDCVVDEGKMLCIVMEHADEGELYTLIHDARGKPFVESQVMFWFVQICVALHHVHSKKMLHRDLKSQNIFRTKNDILKLGDFGIAKVLNSESQMAHTTVGTPYYLSPEICEDKPYGPKSDVWALGCVLYELCSLKRAFEGQSLPALIMKILRGKYPPLPFQYSPELQQLIADCLNRNPNQRPSIKDILNMPFMRPHMEAYFERVGQIMGIQPEELRLPATRKPRPVASRKRVTGKKVTGKKQKDKEKQPALMSTDDKLHAEFLAAIDQAEAETAAEEAEAAAASGQLGEDEEQYEEDFESSEDEEDEGGVGVITIEPSTVAARQATRARPKATAGIYMLPSRGTAVGSLRRPARGAAPVDIASIPTYERDVEWQRRNDEKVPSSRQKDSTAAKLRQFEIEKIKRSRAAEKSQYRQRQQQQGLEAAEERKRRAEGLAHEAATKSQQRSKSQSAARQQASRHKESMRSVRPTLDRSKLRELGEQFKQKLGGSDQGFFNLPDSPQAVADEMGRQQQAIAPGGGISDMIQRQRAQQRRNSTEHIPVEIFCPPSKPGGARTAHAAAAERGTDSEQEADESAMTTHGVVRDDDGERQWSDCQGLVATDPALAGKVPHTRAASLVSSEDELIRTELSIDLSAGRGRPTTDSESDADPYHPHSRWRPSANRIAVTDDDRNADLRRVWSSRAETDLVSVLTQMSSLLSAELDGDEAAAAAVAASADSRHVKNRPTSTSTAAAASAAASVTAGSSARAARPSAHLAPALSEIPEVSESGLSSVADSAGTCEGRGGSSTVATPTEAADSSPLGRAVGSEKTAAETMVNGGSGEAGHGERPRLDASDAVTVDDDDIGPGGEGRRLGESGRPTAEKLESLRQTLEAELGDDLLLRVYRYLRASMETQSAGEMAVGGEEGADERMQGWLSQQLGNERVHLAQAVFRLILYEDDLFT